MFEEVMQYIWEVEHNNNPKKVLHYNTKERNYTLFGIYPFTKLNTQKKISKMIKEYDNIEDASEAIAFDTEVYLDVLSFYRKNFWDKLRLEEVGSIDKCAEVMVFFVNVGISKKTIRVLQSALGVSEDGILGDKTINALKEIDKDLFDVEFDKAEVAYYKSLVKKNKKLQWALNGWVNRAFYI